MASDYAAIRRENERKYGTDIGRIGHYLLAERYGDRTHFVFELLQNAEDALSRRRGRSDSRAVQFRLSSDALEVSHSGQAFDERDVRAICGIAESSKDLTAIGRFGIGFKSVYTFTDRPEIHSGDEHFAIESFVWPKPVERISEQHGDTTFRLPLRAADNTAHREIAAGLQQLGARTLLFLREIEEIAWAVEDGPSGLYLRAKPEDLSPGVRRVTLIGEEKGKPDTEQTWIVFARPAETDDGVVVGHCEIAFAIRQEADRWSVQPVPILRSLPSFQQCWTLT